MKLRLVFALTLLWVGPAVAADQSPWFGSQASPPQQISLNSNSEQIANDSLASDETLTELDCPNEGCPTPKKLGKQAK
jgi:hypothetical protein